MFAFTLKPGIDNYTVFDLSERLRDRGWLIPAYSFPENRQDLAALRVVVRNGFSRDLADLLVADLQRHTAYFDKLTSPLPDAAGKSFSHCTMGRLDGKAILVIGGAQGIGRGCVLAAAAEGAHVVIGDLNEAGAREVAAEATARGARRRRHAAATWSTASRSTRWSRPRSRSSGSLDGLVNLAYCARRPVAAGRAVGRVAGAASCTSTWSAASSRCRRSTRSCATAAGAS